MTTFRDFRGLAIPAEALALGFVDESWHNDAAARMTRVCGSLGQFALTLWVGDETTADEIGGDQFALYFDHTNDDDPGAGPSDECEALYSGDDIGAAIGAARVALRYLSANPDIATVASTAEYVRDI